MTVKLNQEFDTEEEFLDICSNLDPQKVRKFIHFQTTYLFYILDRSSNVQRLV